MFDDNTETVSETVSETSPVVATQFTEKLNCRWSQLNGLQCDWLFNY